MASIPTIKTRIAESPRGIRKGLQAECKDLLKAETEVLSTLAKLVPETMDKQARQALLELALRDIHLAFDALQKQLMDTSSEDRQHSREQKSLERLQKQAKVDETKIDDLTKRLRTTEQQLREAKAASRPISPSPKIGKAAKQPALPSPRETEKDKDKDLLQIPLHKDTASLLAAVDALDGSMTNKQGRVLVTLTERVKECLQVHHRGTSCTLWENNDKQKHHYGRLGYYLNKFMEYIGELLSIDDNLNKKLLPTAKQSRLKTYKGRLDKIDREIDRLSGIHSKYEGISEDVCRHINDLRDTELKAAQNRILNRIDKHMKHVCTTMGEVANMIETNRKLQALPKEHHLD